MIIGHRVSLSVEGDMAFQHVGGSGPRTDEEHSFCAGFPLLNSLSNFAQKRIAQGLTSRFARA